MRVKVKRQKGKGGTYGEDGFTLLEVLVALVIMSIAATLIMQLFSANMRSVSTSGDVVSAVVRGDARIREILAEPSLTEKTWGEITEDGYRIDVSVSEVLKDRTENLPVKMMEVVVTIRWNEERKEKRFQLKTVKMVERSAPAVSSSPATV
jgi:prepilin-type N-terminal cleavage/methylation domain-containing protein